MRGALSQVTFIAISVNPVTCLILMMERELAREREREREALKNNSSS